MAKLIKRGEVGVEPEALPDTEFTQVAEARRPPVIDKDVFAARAAAQQVRERAQAQADEIVAQATQKAAELAAEAEAAATALREEARATGHREGREAGAAELSAAVAATSRRMAELEGQLVPQLSDLAVMIARKILGRELEFHPEAVVQIVKQALGEKARQRREISLRVHPDDLATVREHRAELLELLMRSKEIGIREDPEVARHGVIIETDAGTIDAQLETQLAAFQRVLQDVR